MLAMRCIQLVSFQDRYVDTGFLIWTIWRYGVSIYCNTNAFDLVYLPLQDCYRGEMEYVPSFLVFRTSVYDGVYDIIMETGVILFCYSS